MAKSRVAPKVGDRVRYENMHGDTRAFTVDSILSVQFCGYDSNDRIHYVMLSNPDWEVIND
jgi:hypothetical protein